MEQSNDIFRMLEMMERPGFCVKDHRVVSVNAAAGKYLAPGDSVDLYLRTGLKEYGAFCQGCLYLTLFLAEQTWGASVRRIGEYDVFLLEQEADQAELRAMALAARELREPLSNVMTTADRLFPLSALQDDPATQDLTARLNRGLFQMLRVICNMSDANRYTTTTSSQEVMDINAFLREVFEKVGALVPHTGITLTYSGLESPVFCLVDQEKLERAVLNIVSNAIKFSHRGGAIRAGLARRENMLYLTVEDTGDGLSDSVRGSVHQRYLRQPAIEDGRFGIGLGMVLIRTAAALHGGTVLIDQPGERGTRITMTLQIRKNTESMVRSPVLQVDYAGGRDRSLIELSDCLPAEAYNPENPS